MPGRRLAAISLILLAAACATEDVPGPGPEPCSDQWQQWVESQVTTGDGQGHGPDVGSDEWRSVVEFKLGVRGNPSVPARGSTQWCGYIDTLVRGN